MTQGLVGYPVGMMCVKYARQRNALLGRLQVVIVALEEGHVLLGPLLWLYMY